jgi:hypothetical protein
MFFGYDDDFRRDLLNFGSPFETSWSLQSLVTGAVVAASSFDEA